MSARSRNMLQPENRSLACRFAVVMVFALLCGGCPRSPRLTAEGERLEVSRQLIDYPPSLVMREVATLLNAPADFAVDADGNVIIAESGRGEYDPRVYGFRKDGSFFTIYPPSKQAPFLL